MDSLTWAAIGIAAAWLIYWTYIAIVRSREKKTSILRVFGSWLKNALDTLFGLG